MKRICLMLCCALFLSAAPACAEKYALLVGIDNYSWPVNPLDGCLKDVEMMQKVLTEKFNFPEKHVRTVLDKEASFAEIEYAFQSHLIEQAQPGDAVVFYYSGHGTQTPDGNGDEADGIDETLCPVNIDADDESTWLTDDILNRWLSQLRTTQVTVILDSCFSGSATRGGEEYLSKFADLGFHFSKEKAIRNNYHKSEAAHVLLAASAADQTSLQIPQKGSLFTMILTEMLVNAAADATYQFIIDLVAPAVSQIIAEHFPDSPQTPEAEGNLSQPVFAERPDAPAPAPAQQVAEEPQEALSESVQFYDFPLHISTNKDDFEENDLMTVTVEAGRNCYLALYIIDAEQKVTMIFPNKWQQDNFIKAGESVQIPPEGASFRFKMTGPFGTETLKADANTEQFPDMERADWSKSPFMEFGTLPLPKINTLGVSVEENPDVERSQAVLRYTVRQR